MPEWCSGCWLGSCCEQLAKLLAYGLNFGLPQLIHSLFPIRNRYVFTVITSMSNKFSVYISCFFFLFSGRAATYPLVAWRPTLGRLRPYLWPQMVNLVHYPCG